MHDATTAVQAAPSNSDNRQPRLHLLRNDTLLGACQAIGDALGIPPNLLRLALGGGLFWNPAAIIGGYVSAAILVALIDWFVPPQPRSIEPADTAPGAAPEAARVDAVAAVPTAALQQDERERELVAA